MEKLIKQYAEIKSAEFIEKEPKKFDIVRKNSSEFITELEKVKEFNFVTNLFAEFVFFEFKYEDFLYLFISMTKFMTGINCRLEIDEINSIFVKFYCDENNFQQLAEIYKFRLQLKPYASFYNNLSLRIEFNPNTANEDDINLLFAPNQISDTEQFYKMNQIKDR